jgi:hypothetical protein
MVIKERQAWQEQAERLLKTTEDPRKQSAGIFQTETHLKKLRVEAEALRKANDSSMLYSLASGPGAGLSPALSLDLPTLVFQLERALLHYVPSWPRDGQIYLALDRSATHPTAQGRQNQLYYSLNRV